MKRNIWIQPAFPAEFKVLLPAKCIVFHMIQLNETMEKYQMPMEVVIYKRKTVRYINFTPLSSLLFSIALGTSIKLTLHTGRRGYPKIERFMAIFLVKKGRDP